MTARRSLITLGVAAVLGLLGACGSAFSSGTASSDGGADGTGGDGPTGDGGGADSPGDGSVSVRIVYVSTSGNDTAAGLDPMHPMRTVTAGLAAAKALPGGAAGNTEVHVCAGTYSEDEVSIDFEVALRGAYDCSTWQRTATYGYPSPDGVNITLITSPDTTQQQATLVVSGAVTHATVIDGLVIAGYSKADGGRTAGVEIANNASPVLSNDIIGGGGGTTTAPAAAGSAGVLVDGQAGPEIEECIISGGSGNAPIGSTGVVLNTSGAVSLHDAIITGGTGTTTATSTGTAAIGVDVRMSAATPGMAGLFVGGTDQAGTSGPSVGMHIAGNGGVSATVTGSIVEGGFGLDATSYAIGVLVDSPAGDAGPGGAISLVDDRIYGGLRSVGNQTTIGIDVVAAGSFMVVNSLVHAGSVLDAVGSYTVGIDLAAVASPKVIDDTIYTGAGPGTAIAINGGVTGAVITDDLLLGSNVDIGNIGVAASACGTPFIQSLDNTAFGNLAALYQCSNGPSLPPTTATTLAEMYAAIGSTSTSAADVLVQSSCAKGDTTCAKIPGCPGAPTDCLPGFFGNSWSVADDGVSSLFGTTGPDGGAPIQGWTLKGQSPCTITAGGTVISTIPTDLYGAKRSTSTPTIGAVEYGPTLALCQTN
jgi:hypothetical protein